MREYGSNESLTGRKLCSPILQHEPLFTRIPTILLAEIIGDLQVRNRGTLGGSVAHADPGADYPTIMLLLNARCTAANGKERQIAAEEFFVDIFTTSLGGDLRARSAEVDLPLGVEFDQ